MPQYKYKTAKGIKWMVKFNYEDPKTGITNTEYKRGFSSKKEAKDYEESFVEKLAEADEEEGGFYEPTFGDVFYEYLASHKHEDIKASSLGTKYNIFEHHIFPTFRDMLVDEITDDDIAEIGHWVLKENFRYLFQCRRF